MSHRPRKSSRIQGRESAGHAFRPPARCSAWRGEWTEVVDSRQASAAPERRPRRPDPLRKMWGDSSVGGFASHLKGARLGLFLGFGIERLRGQSAACFLEKNFHFSLSLFQMLLAIARQLDAFL